MLTHSVSGPAGSSRDAVQLHGSELQVRRLESTWRAKVIMGGVLPASLHDTSGSGQLALFASPRVTCRSGLVCVCGFGLLYVIQVTPLMWIDDVRGGARPARWRQHLAAWRLAFVLNPHFDSPF